MYIEVRV